MKRITLILALIFLSMSGICHASMGEDLHLDKDVVIKNDKYISPIIVFAMPMDRAVLSWNATTPNNSYIKVYLRAKTPKGRWSNWFKMGVWGENIRSHSIKEQENNFGRVDIDTLEIKDPATEWQYKIVTHKDKTGTDPKVYSIGLAVKNSKTFKKETSDIKLKTGPLAVPKFSQFEMAIKENRADLGKRICSPTSVAMLLKYNGIKDTSPLDVADHTYDNTADAYGNWPFNTAAMSTYLNKDRTEPLYTTYVRWYESFDKLMDNIHNGQPVIVSIGFKEGELKGAPKPTSGHLVLVKGSDKKHIYVNDPAAPDERSVNRKYLTEEFIKAWKGVAYVVEKNIGTTSGP